MNYYVPPAQGSSSQRQLVPAPPPKISNPDIGHTVGIPIHICADSCIFCVKCTMPQSQQRGPFNQTWTSDGLRKLLHNQVNVCTATQPRPPNGGLPPELRGRTDRFQFNVQLSNMPGDQSSWLFDRQYLLAIISPMVNQATTVTRTNDTPGNCLMTMRRVNHQGQGYLVEFVLHSADHWDIGFWGWYRYYDGSIRVWNWATYDNRQPVLVAWKNPDDPHWYFEETISELRKYETQSATVIIISGMIVFNNQGTTLIQPGNAV
ncbi:hypothetical protein B0H13DRAFT_1911594 [Mycena leptocephala]|nr:hypothetical protein B0H13DRAFT_1911594 [Mycena leptocephala]